MSEPIRVLLDTHAFLWWINGEQALPRKASKIIADESNAVFVSHASVWEMAIKAAIGKLTLPETAGAFVQKQCKLNRFQLLPISFEAVSAVETLAPHHSDPFDRLLVAQCLEKQIPIISSDAVLTKYRVSRIWT